ncbi:MAG: cyclic pyranopterin monophosphate synthase MoaC [Syntrophomonadaceae bacterium]
MEFTHINPQGYARMVDVSSKPDSERMAKAQATVNMKPETLEAIRNGTVKKGDVLAVAQVAGIMGAKQTASLIPMCHPLFISSIDIDFVFDQDNSNIIITSEVKTNGKTGVEMEAITAVTAAALTIYDMCKAVDRWIEVKSIKLLEKYGGKSGFQIRREMDE